jgi:hypothetical protein
MVEQALQCRLAVFANDGFTAVRASSSYAVPRHLANHIDFIGGLIRVTIICVCIFSHLFLQSIPSKKLPKVRRNVLPNNAKQMATFVADSQRKRQNIPWLGVTPRMLRKR